MSIQLVWFKRDLRITDHRPLLQASRRGAVLPLYVFEPEMMLAPDYASQHYQFALECLVELEDSFRKIGLRLGVAHSPMLEVLECLRDEHGSFELWSHEETGNGLSYQRDLAVGLCADRKASYGMNSRAMGWFGVSPVAIAGRGFGPNE